MKLNVTTVLAGAATAAVLTIAASGAALAHGGGMGGNLSHATTTNLVKEAPVSLHDHRRFRFLRFGFVDAAPVCYFKWTTLGRVRICPDLD